MSVSILQLPPTNWQRYRDLRLQAITDAPQSYLDTTEETMAMPEAEWQRQIGNMWFAQVSDELVGMIGVYQEQKQKLSHIANVISFWVNPEYRGQGFGRELLTKALQVAGQMNGVEKVQLGVVTSQLAALALYESVGFERTGYLKKAVKVGEEYFDKIMMEQLINKR